MRARNKQNRKPNNVLHIFCEGSKTEPNYIEHYKDLFCQGKRASVIVEKTDKTTPVQLVEDAVKMKESSLVGKGDEFWVVYDRESPAKYDESLHLKARDLAQTHDVHIAISNVCFEVWLLLHFQPTCAACNTCDELTGRKDFKKHFEDYRKGAGCRFTAGEIANARVNAKRMNAQTIKAADKAWDVPSKWNPYTDVYRLLDAIDEFSPEGRK